MKFRMYWTLSLLIAAVLAGCGGATAQSTSEPPTGGAGDGYSKGVQTVRDVSNATGGTPGNVNTADIARTITGPLELGFEWVRLSVLDNNSHRGENVANYSQANKLSTGPTWAAVSEAADTTGEPGSLVAHEFDVWVTGPDTGSRIGLDVLSGDSLVMRGMGKSPQADATAAIRIGQTTGAPYATWGTGILLQGNYRDSAIKIVAPNGAVVFEIKPNGDVYKKGVKVL